MRKSLKALTGVGAIVVFSSGALAQEIGNNFGAILQAGSTVVYQNNTDFLNSFFPSDTEFGDQVTLGNPTGRNNANLGLAGSSFQLEYYTNFQPEAGVHSGIVRFYRNDGDDFGGVSGPGSNIYSSGTFNLSSDVGTEGGFSTITIQDFDAGSQIDTSTFTYTIQFSGLSGAQEAGLSIYGDASIGASGNYFWQRDSGGDWQQIVLVPEPSIAQLGLLAGLGWLGFMAARRRTAKV